MTEELVILVNDLDRQIGTADKMSVHHDGKLHRAISVCLFDDEGRWLLQRRAATKYHSPGLWANSCCSHPRPGERIADAAHRRLQEELGIDTLLTFCSSFVYRTSLSNGMIEHEFDHLFIGRYSGTCAPSPQEVSAIRWWTHQEIQQSLHDNPRFFAPWFPLIMRQIAHGIMPS